MALRKNLFRSIGLFDLAIGPGTLTRGCSENEFFYRLLRAGHGLVYEPQALIWHYHRSDLAKLHRQIGNWGTGVFAIWTKVFLTDSKMRWRVPIIVFQCFYYRYFKELIKEKKELRDLTKVEAFGALQGPFLYLFALIEVQQKKRKYGSLTQYQIKPKTV
jgi:GT2 family glycosyltransferase